jgi:endonuclease/exonuclease/phosphatase family metal-dependent hydrolase
MQCVRLLKWSAVAIVFAASAGARQGSEASRPQARSPVATGAQAGSRTFKVATWNIRSGMGIRGFHTTSWSSDTINCTDRSKPVNAWGIGLTQAALARVKNDPSIVALALQEAWNCGVPKNVQAVVQFKTASNGRNGTALLARYGFDGPIDYQQIDSKANQWIIGGDVCLDAACSATMPMFSVHFGDAAEDQIPNQAQRALDILKSNSAPRLFMGDLNVYKTDTWNPKVPCTGADNPGRLRTISVIESAGYIDAWKATQTSEGWTGMATRKGCGIPAGNLYKRIDYVFSIGMRTLSTDRFGRAEPGADAPSDHAGLIAELSAVPAHAGRTQTRR